jgi:ribosomal protein S18 acetylase RimI-like enzyme
MKRYSNDRFTIEAACTEDSKEILKIIECDYFPGRISLLYTRRPDALASLLQEGEHVEVIVCRDKQGNKIAGFGAFRLSDMYINGRVQRVAYLFGLKVRPEYRRGFANIIPAVYNQVHERVSRQKVDMVITTILEENQIAQKLLTKAHRNMPTYRPLGEYIVHGLKTVKTRKPDLPKHLSFRLLRMDEWPAAMRFLEEQGRTQQFYPALRVAGTLDKPAFPQNDFYILWDSSVRAIVACGACWDQRAYKQYRVMGYQGAGQWLRALSPVLPWLGFPSLPTPGTDLNFFTLSFWAVAHEAPEYFHGLIQGIAHARPEYAFFLLGMERSRKLRRELQRWRHLEYSSRLYQVTWNNEPSVALDSARDIYLECGNL